jgi:hypothetical protein
MRGSAPSAALTVAFEGSARIQAGECHGHVCRCSVVVGNEWWRRWMEPKIHGDCSSSARARAARHERVHLTVSFRKHAIPRRSYLT